PLVVPLEDSFRRWCSSESTLERPTEETQNRYRAGYAPRVDKNSRLLRRRRNRKPRSGNSHELGWKIQQADGKANITAACNLPAVRTEKRETDVGLGIDLFRPAFHK